VEEVHHERESGEGEGAVRGGRGRETAASGRSEGEENPNSQPYILQVQYRVGMGYLGSEMNSVY